jgi:hypothetical protein
VGGLAFLMFSAVEEQFPKMRNRPEPSFSQNV